MQQCVFPTSRKNRKGESASREQRITNYQARLRSGSCYCSVGELNRRYYLWPCGDTKFIFECWKIFHEWEKRTREAGMFSRREEKFVSPSGHIMYCSIYYEHRWNTKPWNFSSLVENIFHSFAMLTSTTRKEIWTFARPCDILYFFLSITLLHL